MDGNAGLARAAAARTYVVADREQLINVIMSLMEKSTLQDLAWSWVTDALASALITTAGELRGEMDG